MLVLTVWQYESVVQFDLNRVITGEEVTSFALVVRDGVRYRDEKWGEALDFQDCIVAPRRFYAIDMGDVFDKGLYPNGVDLELTVRPQIRIRFDRDSHC